MQIEESEILKLDWDEFKEEFTEAHEQGEHVAFVGPTGSGKSTAALALLEYRRRRVQGTTIVAFGTKPYDSTLKATGWKRIKTWPPPYGEKAVLFWPPYG